MQNVIETCTFQYNFIGKGGTVDISRNEFSIKNSSRNDVELYSQDSTVILDVGNKLTYGIIDHHHLKNPLKVNDKEFCSATGILSAYPSLLSNVDKEKQIDIFVHEDPDFDCYASTYLAEYYLKHDQFPADYEILVDYAEKIDAGKQGIDFNQICTPYTISLVIWTVIENMYGKSISLEEKYRLMMKRGLDLVEYMMTQLNTFHVNEKCINHPGILGIDHPFQDEVKLLNDDYQKYEADLANETICEKSSIFLATNDTRSEVVEVDALFWNQVPKCSLHKLWARADVRSPSKSGYVFTFIPGEVVKKNKLDITKVTIAVDPDYGVSLGGLGKAVELEEQKKEKQIITDKDTLKKRRNEDNHRWNDDWCINEDPWYDGRGHEYTIVDSPSVGSLLTIEEIKNISLRYSKPKVKDSVCRLLYPITFDSGNYEHISESFNNNNNTFTRGRLLENEADIKFFRPYIQNYLFNKDVKNVTNNCKVYNIKFDECSHLNSLKNVCVKKANIILFKYGIGFLVVDTVFNQDSENYDYILFEDVLKTNTSLSSGEGEKEIIKLFSDIFLNTKIDIKNCEKGLVYTHVTLDGQTVFEGQKKEMLYKLTNLLDWEHPVQIEKEFMQENMKKMFLEMDHDYVFGFSKEGAAFLEFDYGVSHLFAEKRKKKIEKKELIQHQFKNTDFVIFLLVVQQRYCLMEFSKSLSKNGTKKNEISKLRKVMLEFITHGWFSQITNDETGMQKFKKWNQIFETEQLHNEVLDQVSTVDDFHRGNNSKRIELLTAVFFPVVVVNVLVGIGYIELGSFVTIPQQFLGLSWLILTSVIVAGGLVVNYLIRRGK